MALRFDDKEQMNEAVLGKDGLPSSGNMQVEAVLEKNTTGSICNHSFI